MLLPALIIAIGCDDMSRDVVPPDDKIDKAGDLTSTLIVNAPVVVDLLQGSSLTGNATISIVEAPAKGTLNILTGSLLKYTPREDFTSGKDHATYRVCVDGDCDTGLLEFNFSGDGDSCKPTAVFDHLAVLNTSKQVFVNILANDIACGGEFDIHTLRIDAQPEHGSATISDGGVLYILPSDFLGADPFIYSVALKSAPDVRYFGIAEVEIKSVSTPLTVVDDIFHYPATEFAQMIRETGNRINFSLDQIFGNDDLGSLKYNDLNVTVTRPGQGTVTYFPNEIFQYAPGVVPPTRSDVFEYQVCHKAECSNWGKVIIYIDEDGSTPIVVADEIILTRAQYDEMIATRGALNLAYSQIIGNDQMGTAPASQIEVVAISPGEGQVTYFKLEMFKFVPNESFHGETYIQYKLVNTFTNLYGYNLIHIKVTDW